MHTPGTIRRAGAAAAAVAIALAVSVGLQASANAQPAYPARPIHLSVPFPSGGVSDASARMVAEQLSRRLGQQVVVENRPGASGNVAGQYIAQAEPDGYTIMLAYNGLITINPFVFAKMSFDTVRDLAPIGKIGDYPSLIAVHPAVEAKTIRELVALSKTRAAGLDFGTSGNGSNEHLIGTLLVQRAGAKLVHVPYKGGGPVLVDAMAGHIPIAMSSVAGATPHVRAGKLRAIAVTSAERWPTLPEVPTVVESGIADVVVVSWIGLVGPGRMPKAIIDRLNEELNAALAGSELKDRIAGLGVRATPGSAEAFRDEIRRDLERNGPIIKAARITVE